MANTLGWFAHLDSFEMMQQLNGVHGGVYMNSHDHPEDATRGPHM